MKIIDPGLYNINFSKVLESVMAHGRGPRCHSTSVLQGDNGAWGTPAHVKNNSEEEKTPQKDTSLTPVALVSGIRQRRSGEAYSLSGHVPQDWKHFAPSPVRRSCIKQTKDVWCHHNTLGSTFRVPFCFVLRSCSVSYFPRLKISSAFLPGGILVLVLFVTRVVTKRDCSPFHKHLSERKYLLVHSIIYSVASTSLRIAQY